MMAALCYMKNLLHVGCGTARKDSTTVAFNTPDWRETRLDIDPTVQPDVVASITDMSAIPSESMDAVYSSHNIEHLYPHEVPIALGEFYRVLKPDGYAVIRCPDLQAVCALVAQDKLLDPAYISPAGPIRPLDMLYGHAPSLASGQVHMAHHCGFTESLILELLWAAGFRAVLTDVRPAAFDLWGIASKAGLTDAELRSLAASHLPA